ncbi:hypothetical protein [Massilia sp. CFBP 13721]|uniref:hypothetical protein n=1 Tax=Massilia sp. CFBP 13721 TaxID=2775300 RepID=UPI0017842D20|nr:hypothetical protein [Massilia sp. CFBP 13721]MBD8673726.1 hypothetical protein [Massilia sp. CFBP 13721]
MRISIEHNFPNVAANIREFGRQGEYAAAVALTRTAQDVQPAIKKEMTRAFDRPTNYTLNSTFLKRATRGNLEARVWLKDNPSSKGTPADRYLAPQIFGGERRQKGMERLLQSSRLMPAGWVAVPAVGAQLDANGNVKRSQIIQILSQLKLQRGAGYESRASGSAASNRTITRQGVTYFALAQPRRGLQPGVYMKKKVGMGTTVKPVFIFARRANYRPIFKFFEVGDATARARFPGHFNAELTKALATARRR